MTSETAVGTHPDFKRYKLTHVGNVMSLWCLNCHSDNDGCVAEYKNSSDFPVDGIYLALLAHEEEHRMPHRVYGKPIGCTPHDNYVSEECRHAKEDKVDNLHHWCHLMCKLCASLCVCDCHGGKNAG